MTGRKSGSSKNENAVDLIKDNIVSRKTAGHVPKMLGRVLAIFLKLPGSRVSFMVNGERVNRVGGYDLEIPVRAKLEGHTKPVAWPKEKI